MGEATSVTGVLLDLSGVLYLGNDAIPGATEAIARLERSELPVAFVTNVTRTPRAALLERLSGMGLAVPDEALFSAPQAARDYLERHGLVPYAIVHEALEPELADLASDAPTAVLIGDAADGFTYQRMNEAFRLVKGGAPLLAMGRTRYFQDGDELSLDAGPFVAALEFAAGVEAQVVGKPAPEFFEAAAHQLARPLGDVVMVGDDVQSDVLAARGAGLQAVLVRTGKYRDGDDVLAEAHGAVVADDISAAVDWILGHAAVT